MTKQDNKILGISQTIDALTEQRRRWEEGTYAASNEELYALLGNCSSSGFLEPLGI